MYRVRPGTMGFGPVRYLVLPRTLAAGAENHELGPLCIFQSALGLFSPRVTTGTLGITRPYRGE